MNELRFDLPFFPSRKCFIVIHRAGNTRTGHLPPHSDNTVSAKSADPASGDFKDCDQIPNKLHFSHFPNFLLKWLLITVRQCSSLLYVYLSLTHLRNTRANVNLQTTLSDTPEQSPHPESLGAGFFSGTSYLRGSRLSSGTCSVWKRAQTPSAVWGPGDGGRPRPSALPWRRLLWDGRRFLDEL